MTQKSNAQYVAAYEPKLGKLTRNGTDGRVYGGDKNLVHIPDGERKAAGALIAHEVDRIIRFMSTQSAIVKDKGVLCPGCTMIAVLNAAIILAENNGQPLRELGATLGNAFLKLARNPENGLTEEIEVLVDPPEDPVEQFNNIARLAFAPVGGVA
jgi:molybdopterin/thiamine biosynthesis adenylyltransferase